MKQRHCKDIVWMKCILKERIKRKKIEWMKDNKKIRSELDAFQKKKRKMRK